MTRRVSNSEEIDGDALCETPLHPSVCEHIGRELRAVYNGVLAEPIPERFFTLLNRLEGETICLTEAVVTRGDIFESIRGRIGG